MCRQCFRQYAKDIGFVKSSSSSKSISYIRSFRRFLNTTQRRRDSPRIKSATRSYASSALSVALSVAFLRPWCVAGGLHPSSSPSHSASLMGSASDDWSMSVTAPGSWLSSDPEPEPWGCCCCCCWWPWEPWDGGLALILFFSRTNLSRSAFQRRMHSAGSSPSAPPIVRHVAVVALLFLRDGHALSYRRRCLRTSSASRSSKSSI
ncbi:hypothetical protein CRUP_036893 [Coryphaenoides rupestris]|nr:hypothetical protein CRUP_036893 [Coryphaenoides rupestris]